MRLTLTSSTPWHSNYCADNDDVVYVVRSSCKVLVLKTKIEKAVGPGNQFETIGSIDFNMGSSSVITLNGNIMKANSVFRYMYWSGNRVFTGPDGIGYKWKSGFTKPELYLNDGRKTIVAKYHRPHSSAFSGKRAASLEIFPPADGIADFIVASFIYVEKMRRDGRTEHADEGGSNISASGAAGDAGGNGGGEDKEGETFPIPQNPSAMELILSSSSPWNSNYVDSRTGKVVYAASAPSRFFGWTVTLQKAAPENLLAPLATIELKAFSSSTITINDQILKINRFFTEGWSGSQAFIGPDGRGYKWKLLSTKPALYLNDGTNALVAKYHHSHRGVRSPKRPTSLEIFYPGDQIADIIVTTFIYIERLRSHRENERRRNVTFKS